MIGSTHRIVGFQTGLLFGLAAGFPAWQSLAAGVIASASSNGPFSPDGDQTWLRFLGRHRGVTHWIGWPILVAMFTPDPTGTGWAVIALNLGYASHIGADAIYGKPGVPLLPFAPWYFVGIGLRCEGHRTIRSSGDWQLDEIQERRTVKVGQSEKYLRHVLQYLSIPLGTWVVLAPVFAR